LIDDENITRDLKIDIIAGQESKFAHDVFTAFFTTRIRRQLEEKAAANKTWHPRAPPEPLDLTVLLATSCNSLSVTCFALAFVM
jgi:hypothetical protein